MSAYVPDEEFDRRLILATQQGLPLVARPYDQLAETLATTPARVMAHLSAMLERGVIRRIGVVPNHYAIGYVANGMSVWAIDPEHVDAVGERVGRIESVSHCYRRPPRLPDWPYNLFAMVHGRELDAVLAQVAAIAKVIEVEFPGACRQHDVLFSSRILKKAGLRLSAKS